MYKRLHIIGGIGGCLGGALLAYLGYASGEPATLEIGAAILAASAIYLLFRGRIASSPNPSLPASKSLALILHIIFFATFAASIYLMDSSPFRPPLYFLLTSISVAAVAGGILSSSNNKFQTGLLLLEILLISFSLRYGLMYEFPGFYGTDPWWHSLVVEGWLNNGHIVAQLPTGYTSYADFPIMHLNIMGMRLITQLDPKDSLFLSIGLFYILSTLFVFLLGQRLINTKTGLLAALLISITSFHIGWGAWLIPTSLGIGIFAMLLWLIFKGNRNISSTLILIIMSFVLVFTHTIAAFATALALVFFLIASQVFKRLPGASGEQVNAGYSFLALFWVVMLTRWIYSFYSPSLSFFDAAFGWFVNALRVDVQYTGAAFEALATPQGTLNRVGFLMLIVFIVIGSLFWLSKGAISNKRAAIIIGAFGLSVVTFVLPFFNIENFIPGRWLPFIAVLGAVVIAEGILALSRLLNGGVMKSLLMVLIVFIFSMFMINSHGVNTRTPFYGKDYMQDPERYAFNESELTAVNSISEIYDGKITTDNEYRKMPFEGRAGLERVSSLSIEAENEGLVIIRKYIYTHQFAGGGSERESRDLLDSFSSSGYNMIYNNGEVEAYLPR